ncbi:MAG: hypothetical protein M1825_005056 [Sarcosagium campestre]|nr:MAG: hypothetical protein M1825_005056 [Sarcosagium campestre]
MRFVYCQSHLKYVSRIHRDAASRFRRFASTVTNEPSGEATDPRLGDLGRTIENDYASIRDKYAAPKNPIILAHGLFGFDELRLAGSILPAVHYWRGITEALTANGIEIITAAVPPSASIEERAKALGQQIREKAAGKTVNIIAHSMTLIQNRGLDARFMISRLQAPSNVNVLSLTTIATPHRGSSIADYIFEHVGDKRVPKLYKLLESMQIQTGAFKQLTRRAMLDDFNPHTPDVDTVRYFSYGASAKPPIWSVFRQSERIIMEKEGPNDGLVSVASSKWGDNSSDYKGTLIGVNHLDLINWTNQLNWFARSLVGQSRKFNAIAFYLDIADMLAKEGL